MLQCLQRSEHPRGEDVREQEQRCVRERACRHGGGERAEAEERPPGLWDARVLGLAAGEGGDAEQAGVDAPAGEADAAEAVCVVRFRGG